MASNDELIYFIRTSTDTSLDHMLAEAYKMAKVTDQLVTVQVKIRDLETMVCSVHPDGEVVNGDTPALSLAESDSLVAKIKKAVRNNEELHNGRQ